MDKIVIIIPKVDNLIQYTSYIIVELKKEFGAMGAPSPFVQDLFLNDNGKAPLSYLKHGVLLDRNYFNP